MGKEELKLLAFTILLFAVSMILSIIVYNAVVELVTIKKFSN
jgi:hypothetical protein